MTQPPHPRPIVLLGPTAGGKSSLALELARHLGGEVIGADSMQVYRHLDAGTAKPTHAMRQAVPHHGVDIVEPTQRFTVHDWLTMAQREIARIQQAGGTPIIVGGTNLYLKALLDGMFDGPGQDPAFRAALDGTDTPLLHERLRQVDPETADRLKPADRQRIVRALEVYELTGKPISALQTQWSDVRCAMSDVRGEGSNMAGRTSNIGHRTFRLLGLRWSAEDINTRINLRVKAMFYPDKVDPELANDVCINGESLIDEVKRLKDEGRFDPIPAENTNPQSEIQNPKSLAPNQAREALGYKQLLAVLEGTDPKLKTIDDAFERTKVLTRRFAKQQRTWLKRFTDTHWIDCPRKGDPGSTGDVAGPALAWATSTR
ncbi:MAG: tRNA (adenosine(37)-N6)-dimethylallyltransferase MiaA [Planctomycetota bacterium]